MDKLYRVTVYGQFQRIYVLASSFDEAESKVTVHLLLEREKEKLKPPKVTNREGDLSPFFIENEEEESIKVIQIERLSEQVIN